MKQKSKRMLTSITFNSDHYLANLLVLVKLLGYPIGWAKNLCRNQQPGKETHLIPYVEIKSKYSTDDLISKAEYYDIKLTIINQ